MENILKSKIFYIDERTFSPNSIFPTVRDIFVKQLPGRNDIQELVNMSTLQYKLVEYCVTVLLIQLLY